MTDKGSEQQPGTKERQRIAELERELCKAREDRILATEQAETLQRILTATHEELGSLLTSSETGAMFLDQQLHIKSATPGIQQHFNILPCDIGRPITDMVSNLLYDTLEHDVKQVIATLALKEIVISSKDEKWFNMRIIPHSTASGVIDGVMVTLTNITKLKNTHDRLRDSGDKLLAAINQLPIVVWNQDMDLRYTWIHNPHPAFNAADTIAKQDEDLLPPEDAANLVRIKRKVLDTGVGVREKVRTTIEGQHYYYDLTVEPLLESHSRIIGISCASMQISKNTYDQK